MIKNVLLAFIFLLIILTNIPSAFAKEEFSSNYDVLYDVSDDGITQVTEKITLKNLTGNYFASSFTLSILADNISELLAFDNLGPIPVSLSKVGSKSQIKVSFNNQVIGKNKQYSFSLRFNSKDFAQKQGQIWQVSVPKISSQSSTDEFNLSLLVPVEFGDPTIILPQPKNTAEENGKIKFDFIKEQLLESGVLASFGTEQFFDFKLIYNLKNNSVLPQIVKISLPANGDYQQVSINKITPQPVNVTVDEEGNYLAWFKLGRMASLEAVVEGSTRLSIDRFKKVTNISPKMGLILTSNQKYWDKDNPLIKTKLAQIFDDSKPVGNGQKVTLISRYVANTLGFDFDRAKNNDFQRLGAITTLNNPQKALCLEFSDLFIALTRAADIPSRLNIGYSFSGNSKLRPLSENGLHCWAQYFDPPAGGWVIVDPTWESTTGGVNYFSKFDLNHFILANRGVSPKEPKVASQVVFNFSDKFEASGKLNLEISAPDTIFALFPSKAKIIVKNQGNFTISKADLVFSSAKLPVLGVKSFTLPEIPPFGVFEYEFDLKADSLWSSYEDILQLRVDDQSIDRKILIKPFFEYKYFSLGVLAVTLFMVFAYILLVGAYFRKVDRHRKKT